MSKRRCRHFDPREAGAAISLRSDRGVATSGGFVDSWTSTAGSVVASGSGTARPAFVASDANFGGFPSLTFDGSNDQMALSAGALSIVQNVGQARSLVVTRDDGAITFGPRFTFFVSTGTNPAATRFGSLTHTFPTQQAIAGARRLDADALALSLSGLASNVNHIAEGLALFSAGTISAARNGVFGSSVALPSGAGMTSNTASQAGLVGSTGGTNYHQGPITQITVFNTAIDAALAARVRHNAARTFLIPCS